MDSIRQLWDYPRDFIKEKVSENNITSEDDTAGKVANVVTLAGYVTLGYGLYKVFSNRKSRNKMSKVVKNLSNSVGGNLFGKSRRRRSRKGSKKQKKMRRTRH